KKVSHGLALQVTKGLQCVVAGRVVRAAVGRWQNAGAVLRHLAVLGSRWRAPCLWHKSQNAMPLLRHRHRCSVRLKLPPSLENDQSRLIDRGAVVALPLWP